MTEREALLVAVAANSGDDLPRRVLADWIEENGEPERAALIHLEIAVRGGATDRPTLRAYRRAVASTTWHTPAELLGIRQTIVAISPDARGGMGRAEYVTRLERVVAAVSPLFPARHDLVRLAARYEHWEPPHGHGQTRLVDGHSTGYEVRSHFSSDPLGGRWVAGSGLTTIAGTGAACWEEAVLLGLAARGRQRNFSGAVVSDATRHIRIV